MTTEQLNPIKELLLKEVREMVETGKDVVVASYEKLPPDRAWEFRRDLKKVGGQFKVIRKGLFRKYAEKYKQDDKLFDGKFSVGVVVADKATTMEAVKVVTKHATDNKDHKVEILFGEIDGEMMKGADIKYLSTLPSLEVLRAQLLSIFASPMSQLLSVLEAAAEKKS